MWPADCVIFSQDARGQPGRAKTEGSRLEKETARRSLIVRLRARSLPRQTRGSAKSAAEEGGEPSLAPTTDLSLSEIGPLACLQLWLARSSDLGSGGPVLCTAGGRDRTPGRYLLDRVRVLPLSSCLACPAGIWAVRLAWGFLLVQQCGQVIPLCPFSH